MDEWCVGMGRVDVSRACTFKYAESMLLGSRDKERDEEDGFCFGHVCTSGKTLLTRRGDEGAAGGQE